MIYSDHHINSGKVLKDDMTLASYNLTEKDFVVVMVTKPKGQPTTSIPPPKPVEAVVIQEPVVSPTPTSMPTDAVFTESSLGMKLTYGQ